MSAKIKILIKKLENVARITERKTFDQSEERTLNHAVWFKGLTKYQEFGVREQILDFETSTGIKVNSWIDQNKENDYDLLIKY